ncbi:MAG: bifunctional riboflavin kinase/FAD synthetase [Lachnospiraceae bacterium]|nr:bifunctional riboflavin kinase/FAD synthetase [Lachnospiraceae bacterium]
MLYLKNEEARQFNTKNTAVALGKFDGIHLGHQLLIKGLLEEQKKGRQALVFTFGDAPNKILGKGFTKNIYTSEEKAYYFSRFGIDVLLEYPFTKEFAFCTPEDFAAECLVGQLGVSSIYVGEDFRFGRGRSGNVALLKALGNQYNFEIHAIPKKSLHGKIVSSTAIRDLLENHFHAANEMLGNPYFIYGEVKHGRHLGRTIGFPTINQQIQEHKLIPAYGVYASRVEIDGIYYKAISNLGVKPTIEGERKAGLETHILDFSGNLYGKYLQTELLYFIRQEERFADIGSLKEQIQLDIAYVLKE